MSLTSHLKRKDSLIREFLYNAFPNTKPFLREARREQREAPTNRPTEQVPWGTVGMSLDYRLRYYFAITPANELAAWRGAGRWRDRTVTQPDGTDIEIPGLITLPTPHPSPQVVEAFFEELGRFLDEARPASRCLGPQQERELARYCNVLALFEEIYRAGPRDKFNGFTNSSDMSCSTTVITIKSPGSDCTSPDKVCWSSGSWPMPSAS
jgi:hypothetical protein